MVVQGVLAVFNVSDPNKMVVTKHIAFPGEYFWGVEYDCVSDRVWVVSGSLHAGTSAILLLVDAEEAEEH